MRQLFFLTILSSFLFGCESNELLTPEISEEKNIFPTHLATFDIEGMMCQKGCGAAIRKGLLDTGGVSEVEVAFDDEHPLSQIKVYFDIKKTSTDKMIKVIGGLADNRYSAKLKKVTQSTLSAVNVKTDEVQDDHSLNGLSSREVSSKSFTFPNLTKLLNGLIN
ncbi:heavy-metal-associated domain-containing protein [Brumimicrobium mesophilum]|uniref:heavy-metal-associated domain-containing protein n=1 Tax=Brumimicrobium mesophilum TaxID=392717 RepID=UPI000D143BB9|nr:heavy metal-associated domain-containing protein [Brumimicrobium mesophilum]